MSAVLPAPVPMLALRSTVFYLGYASSIIIWATLSMVVGPFLPFRARYVFVIKWWTRFAINWLRLTCGIDYRIEGTENIPDEACVILSKHQSQWETFFLQTLFVPQCTLIKKELLSLPFFGWAFRLVRPIAIDRTNRKTALLTLIKQGRERLAEGIWVLVFPEGTRVFPGHRKNYLRGGAALACSVGVPVLPVTHNAGLFWPPHRFLKYPGTVQVIIGPLVPTTDRTPEQVLGEVHSWIDATTVAIGGESPPPYLT